jgi:hypothetical protein
MESENQAKNQIEKGVPLSILFKPMYETLVSILIASLFISRKLDAESRNSVLSLIFCLPAPSFFYRIKIPSGVIDPLFYNCSPYTFSLFQSSNF